MSLTLAPETGGSVAAFRVGGRDIMRPAPDGADDALDMACFPLVPFSNRIAHGQFSWRGQAISLPPTMGDHPHAIHGQGWRAGWDVLHAGQVMAKLGFAHAPGAWPWAYEARQSFLLDEAGFTHTLVVVNTAEAAMPAGLGVHPYFPRTPECRIEARLAGRWETTAQGLPTEHRALAAGERFDSGRRVMDLTLDHVFTGWTREARIVWPEWGLALAVEASPLLDHLVLYVPPRESFFCIEPVSHMTDAFNRMGPDGPVTGARVLAPGEELAAQVRYTVLAA